MNQSRNVNPEMQRAVELHQLGRLGEAEAGYRRIADRSPNDGDVRHLLGVLLIQTSRAEEALPLLERAIAIMPNNASYHASLGRALHALSRHRQAAEPLRRVTEIEPHSPKAWSDLGAVLQAVGEREEAKAAYRKAFSLNPRHITSRYNLATVLRGEGLLGEAVELLSTLVREHPNQAAFRTTLAGYLLEAGDVGAALSHCDAALATNPRDLMAMTFKSVALLRSGDRAGARRLVDFDRLLHSALIRPPAPWPDLEALHAALAEHLLRHPSLEHERPQNATRHGRHTDNLLLDPNPGPMRDLARVFNESLGAYLRDLPSDPSHPFLARRPARWRLVAWGVVMDQDGHQLPHTHPDGWVSGVYYVRVPATVDASDRERAGWLEFGQPLPELLGDARPELSHLLPRPGMLVLFPSYFYHRTRPFKGSEQRISIAFDAVPIDPR